jgi:hypothetical protein
MLSFLISNAMVRAEADMLEEWLAWWQNTTPETKALVQDAGLAAAALLAGFVIGSMVGRALRAKNFDALLRISGSAEPNHGFSATFFAAMLVRLTVWGGAAAWLARQHGRPDLATTFGSILSRTWAAVGILVVTLAVGSFLARRVIDCLQGLSRTDSTSRNGTAGSSNALAGAAGAGVYSLVLLLALLITADLFDWPLSRTAAQSLWQLAQHLLIAGAALLIAGFGARWARNLTTVEPTASPEKRAGQYTALVIVGGTTVLAVAVLLSAASLFLGVVTLAVLGVLIWLLRGHLPDITAGLQLRANKVSEVWYDGAPWQVSEVGLLTTEMGRAGQFSRFQNRVVLEARMHGIPAQAGHR